jgi:hypothetical protein
MPIESTPLMPPWTLTANLMFMENFNGPGRGAVLSFSGLEGSPVVPKRVLKTYAEICKSLSYLPKFTL